MKRKIIAIFLSLSLFAGLLCSLQILAKADVDLSPKAVMDAAFSGNYNAEEVYNMARSTKSDCSAIENAAVEQMLCKYAGVLESVVTDGKLNAYSAILSPELEAALSARAENAKAYAKACNQQYIEAKSLFEVKAFSKSDGKYTAQIYEWVMIKYSQNGVYDYSGFGFNHTVTLDENMIISDKILDDAFIQQADTPDTVTYESYYNEPTAKAVSLPYSAEKAIAYADKYALTYNTAYKNMNDVGGDCCNFVSQCLFAGGIPMSDGWYYKSQSNFSSSWSLVKSNIAYFSSFGTFIKNPQPSQVKAGNPVYYYSATSTDGVHTSICVGTNTAGTPVINAHNNDRYRVDWTLGGSKYFPGGNSTIQLNVADVTATTTTEKPTTATTATATTSAATKPDNTNKVAGDANSDGVVNSKDVLILRKNLAKMPVQIDLYLSDVNADGFVDTKDLLLLRKYLAGQNVILKLK